MGDDLKKLAKQMKTAFKGSGINITQGDVEEALTKASESCGSCWSIGCRDGCDKGCLSACKTGKK